MEEGSHVEEGSGAESSASFMMQSNPYLSMSIQQQRGRLPIFKHRTQLLYLVEKFQVVVVVGGMIWIKENLTGPFTHIFRDRLW